jgi:hypothetical protein
LTETDDIKQPWSLNSHSHFSRLADAASLIPNAFVRFGRTAAVIKTLQSNYNESWNIFKE